MEEKYRNRPDISILVVDKNSNPFLSEDSHHDIADVAYFLNSYGFSVDLTWSLARYKFKDFEKFIQKTINQLEAKKNKDWGGEDINKIMRKNYDEDISKFKRRKKLFRKTPIKSIDDLANYNFMILHPTLQDCDGYLSKILKKYPNIPIFTPKKAISQTTAVKNIRVSNKKLVKSQKQSLDFITKDALYEAYSIDGDDFTYNCFELICHLLDKKEK